VARAKQPTSIQSLNAQAAAYASWANTVDPTARTAPARAAFLDRFDREYADLPDEDRIRRATAARKAYFKKLAAKSVQARKRAS
jgi:hypothetical protein